MTCQLNYNISVVKGDKLGIWNHNNKLPSVFHANYPGYL